MMTPEQFLKENEEKKLQVKMMNVGNSGSGKTYLSATFPKCYFLMTEPGGADTFRFNKHLLKNITGWDYFIPTSTDDTKRVFEELNAACDNARKLATDGKIETLVLDNMSFLSENRWIYINRYEKQVAKSGEINTMAMYGALGRWLYQFTLMKLLSCPCNVIVNCHEMLENDETLAKKPDKSSPILANILGGFRDKADGMFSCVFYLTKIKSKGGGYEYWARTNKGNGKNAKNRLNLPETIQNVSYDTIVSAIQGSLNHKEG